ncbi:methionine adenosyltransferase [Frankia sp. AgB1.9]|uniref:methionine adenosyltransferase n=1 Tax=unclassified Frankia TaxID=2632575 RepID=UPI001933847C|nr:MULTISPECIES: methionine adenosyltransferase [unclassified Frankia]MBL7494101.1 methionine adenosyltransferase [Frankia sp. AgW1.1]MBL7553279.1 methionine adenosyltransferase [Frankia sp. AgB1.9]MBL7625297.1 methionine adenosyltransferase [Frankia sp. AgB1.8]
MSRRLFTSESVTEGHPDKAADQVSDALLDAYLAADRRSRVAVETLVANGKVHVAGEVTSDADVDVVGTVRRTLAGIGYDAATGFDAAKVEVLVSIGQQSPDIAQGVDNAYEARTGLGASAQGGARGHAGRDDELSRQGAGDQGIMFGYASDETPALMPLPITLAHRLAGRLAAVRHDRSLPYLRPDGKTQVTIEYDGDRPARLDTVVVSAHHEPGLDLDGRLAPDIRTHVVEPELKRLAEELGSRAGLEVDGYRLLVNPTGRFELGGPGADAGLTGRKIIIDTYGGYARHGGGAFSGKDPSKVDRSAAYALRWVARNVVAAGLARRVELQVAYAIGKAEPVGLFVETFGTEQVSPALIERAVTDVFDLRPAAIIRDLDLLRPIYQQTAAYGHFGRPLPDFTWERSDRAAALRAATTSN